MSTPADSLSLFLPSVSTVARPEASLNVKKHHGSAFPLSPPVWLPWKKHELEIQEEQMQFTYLTCLSPLVPNDTGESGGEGSTKPKSDLPFLGSNRNNDLLSPISRRLHPNLIRYVSLSSCSFAFPQMPARASRRGLISVSSSSF